MEGKGGIWLSDRAPSSLVDRYHVIGCFCVKPIGFPGGAEGFAFRTRSAPGLGISEIGYHPCSLLVFDSLCGRCPSMTRAA